MQMTRRIRTYLSGTGLGPTLVRATSGSTGLRIAGMGFGFLVGILLARGLGAEGYGIYGVAMSIIALLTVPTEFGLPQLLTREVASAHVARDWGRLRGMLDWSSRVSLAMSAVIGLGVVAWLLSSGRGLASPLGMALLAGILLVPLAAQVSMRSAALRGLQRIVTGQLPDVLLRPMLHALLLALAVWWFAPLTPVLAMASGVAAAALSLIAAQALLRRTLPAEVDAVPAILRSRDWWSSALPMALTEGMRILQGHVAILVLGAMATMAEAGLFRVATSVSLLIGTPLTLFAIVCAPIIAQLHAQGHRARLQRLLWWTSLAMAVSTLLLTVPFMVAGEHLLALAFGEEYRQANTALLILSAGLVVNGWFGVSATLLNMTGLQNRVTYASLLSLAVLVVLMFPLTTFAGVDGAAWATTLSLLAWCLVMWHDGRKLLSLDSSCTFFMRTLRAER